MSELVPYKKFAVGYDRTETYSFIDLITPYLPTIKEVYFSWPGMISGRELRDGIAFNSEKETLLSDLNWCRSNGLGLDLLFNANCYGQDAFGEKLRLQVYDILNELKTNGLFPEVVTTTSQYIAKIIKVKYPEIDIRASVNMQLSSTKSMEFISDIFDSFYICRDIQRNLDTMKIFSVWCQTHGKKLCMLVNSGCLRRCPVQIWHDNFLCHESWRGEEQEFILRYPYRLCQRHFNEKKNAVDYLRMSWIRPEDIHYYEPYTSVMKLATRRTVHPELMLKAYCEGHYEGNLLDFIGTNNMYYTLENSAFPADWVESGIAQKCALNCTECGKCNEVLKLVSRTVKLLNHTYSFNYSFAESQNQHKGTE